jgi:hypothetical protein
MSDGLRPEAELAELNPIEPSAKRHIFVPLAQIVLRAQGSIPKWLPCADFGYSIWLAGSKAEIARIMLLGEVIEVHADGTRVVPAHHMKGRRC